MNAGETEGEQRGLGRRQVLVGAASLAALAACGAGGGHTTSRRSTTVPTPTTRHTARLRGDPFGLGVASGDPTADGIVLWTRLAPTPLSEGDLSGMPDDPVDVVWEIAIDDRFGSVVARGAATAEPGAGHSVHVEVDGLDPATDHHYRFAVGEWTSPVGRTRTLAAPGERPARFALAVANCQLLDAGRYAAYRHMVDEDLDLVLHLGDYVYEYGGERALPNRIPGRLDDWRLRYAAYRSDPDLRAAHARFPFVCTWDDHEVANNYAGLSLPDDTPPEMVREMRVAAYRAWWENLPVRLPAPEGDALDVHRHLDVGDLVRLHVLDQRQHADEPPCRDTTAGTDLGDCAARTGDERTLLGGEQAGWLDESLAGSGATWDLLGNPVVLAGIDTGTETPLHYLETWDGYPAEQERVIAALDGVDNPVVLTGDYHQAMVLDVHRTPFDTDSDLVCTELMAPPISSPLFSQDVAPRTPHLREQLDAHGYLTVEVTPDDLTGRFRVLDDVTDADSAITTASTWTVAAGERRATRA